MLACDVPMKHYAEFSYDIYCICVVGRLRFSGCHMLNPMRQMGAMFFFVVHSAPACFATERKICTLTVLDVVISR